VKLNENSCHYFHKSNLASYEISCLITKNKKPHTTGETLLLLAAIKMYEIMHGENYGRALKTLALLQLESSADSLQRPNATTFQLFFDKVLGFPNR
jgi:hypothetical protein